MNVYYITGTSRGLGRALATALLDDDRGRVFGIGRHHTIKHDRYEHITLDLSDVEAVQRFRFEVPRGAGRLVLVNNAGVISPVSPVGRIDGTALVPAMTVNLISPALLMNSFLRDSRKSRAERLIVNISSGAARHAIDSWSGYCAAKAGMDMYSEVLHSEQAIHAAQHPVRVFSIAPGVVDTDMQKQIRSVPKKDFAGKDRFVRLKKDGALASPEKTAAAIIDLMENPDRYDQVCLDVRDLAE